MKIQLCLVESNFRAPTPPLPPGPTGPSALASEAKLRRARETGNRFQTDIPVPTNFVPPITCQSMIEEIATGNGSPKARLVFDMFHLADSRATWNRNEVTALARHGIDKFSSGLERYRQAPSSMLKMIKALLKIFAANPEGNDFAHEPTKFGDDGFRPYTLPELMKKARLTRRTATRALGWWADAGVVVRRQEIDVVNKIYKSAEFKFDPVAFQEIYITFRELSGFRKTGKSKADEPATNEALSEYLPQDIPAGYSPENTAVSPGQPMAMHGQHSCNVLPSVGLVGATVGGDVPSIDASTSVFPAPTLRKRPIPVPGMDLFSKNPENPSESCVSESELEVIRRYDVWGGSQARSFGMARGVRYA